MHNIHVDEYLKDMSTWCKKKWCGVNSRQIGMYRLMSEIAFLSEIKVNDWASPVRSKLQKFFLKKIKNKIYIGFI